MTIATLFTDYWAVLIALVGVIWWASRIDTIVGGLGDKFKSIDDKFKSIDSEFEKINTLLSDIFSLVRGNRVDETNSPVRLNDYGRELSEKLNISEFIQVDLKNLKINKTMNPYQIQEACFDYAQAKLINDISPDAREKLEQLAYDEGVEIQKVLRVLGIELRDAKLKELGVNTSNIDQHDPEQKS